MRTRILGKSNLAVSAIAYGCMGLANVYGPGAGRQEAMVWQGVTFGRERGGG